MIGPGGFDAGGPAPGRRRETLTQEQALARYEAACQKKARESLKIATHKLAAEKAQAEYEAARAEADEMKRLLASMGSR